MQAIGAALIGVGIFLVERDRTAFAKAFLIVSCFYLLVGTLGICYGFCPCLGLLWFLALTLLLIFQVAMLTLITAWRKSTLKRIAEIDGGNTPHAHRGYEFFNKNARAMVILLAIGVAAQLLALGCLSSRAMKSRRNNNAEHE